MATRSDLSPPAAVGIWAASLIGSWTMATAILGAINGAVIDCEPGSVTPAAEGAGAGSGVGGWVMLTVAALVPVAVMIAVAPAAVRGRLIGLAAVVAAVGFVAASTWIGPCL